MYPIQSPFSSIINFNSNQKLNKIDFIKLFPSNDQDSHLSDTLTDILSLFRDEKITLLHAILSNTPMEQRKELFTPLSKYMGAFGPLVMKTLALKTPEEQVAILQIFGAAAHDHLGIRDINLLLDAICSMDLPKDSLLFSHLIKTLIHDFSSLEEIQDTLTFFIKMTETEREKLIKYINSIRSQKKLFPSSQSQPHLEEKKKLLLFLKTLSDINFKSFISINRKFQLDLLCLSQQQQKYAYGQLMKIPEEELEEAFRAIKALLSYGMTMPATGVAVLEIVRKMSIADRLKIVDLIREFPRKTSTLALLGLFLLPNLQVASEMNAYSKNELCCLAKTLYEIHGAGTLDIIEDIKPFIKQGMRPIEISKIACLLSRLPQNQRKEAASVALELIDGEPNFFDQITILYIVTHAENPIKALQLAIKLFQPNLPVIFKMSLFLIIPEQPHLLNVPQIKFQVIQLSNQKLDEVTLEFNKIINKLEELPIDGSIDQLQKTYDLIQSEMNIRLSYIPLVSASENST